ncbi:MAG TPA: outer membrane protein assembly factor BamC [Methylophilaceae bacterium]|jgi:outer membrane protein assembly factor BamC
MNQSKFKALTLFCLVALTITGCDSIPFLDTTPDYKGAGRARPLEVPPDLTSVSSSDTYTVPGGTTTYSGYSQEQEGQEAGVEKILPSQDSVRFVRAGSQRWLVVDAPPEKIWPVVREFWTDLGFAVRLENSETGVMETEWADAEGLKGNTKGTYLEKFDSYIDKLSGLENRQKFRTRLDRGNDQNTTEIYLSHRSLSTAPDDGKTRIQTQYGEIETGYKSQKTSKSEQDKAIEEDIDAELLRRLMVKLGVEEKRSQSIIASPVQETRAVISQDKDGTVNLAVNDQFDRAWRRVGLALDRIGFVVEDKDRSKGVFYVRYSDVDIDDEPAKKKGLLDKLKFWGDDEKKEPEPEPKKDDGSVVDKLKFWKGSDKEKVDPSKQYQVKVESSGSGSQVIVADRDGKRSRTNTGNRIIKLLYEQLK